MHVFIKFYFGFKYLIDFEILHYQFNQFIRYQVYTTLSNIQAKSLFGNNQRSGARNWSSTYFENVTQKMW